MPELLVKSKERVKQRTVWYAAELAVMFNVTHRFAMRATKDQNLDRTYTGDINFDKIRMSTYFKDAPKPQNEATKLAFHEEICVICGNEFTTRGFSGKAFCDVCKGTESTLRLIKYGLSEVAFNSMLEKQNNCCAVCGSFFDEIKQAKDKRNVKNVDHDHTTGKIRGIVCNHCNIFIGFCDKPGLLDRALKYLEYHA